MTGRRARRRGGRLPWWRLVNLSRRRPSGMAVEGLLVALIGTVLVVGAGVVGTLTGPAAVRSGAAGVVCTLALTLYLLIVRAGRVLVCAVVMTGLALAVFVPRVTAEVALTERGLRQDVIVTAVRTVQSPDGRSSQRCSFALQDGAPVPVAIRRGCQAHTTVGERITALFDPKGVLTPRATGPIRLGRLIGTAVLALLLLVLCFLAVARSYRLPPQHKARASAPRP